MATGPEDRQPRDIALEQGTRQLAADLEVQSDPEDGRPRTSPHGDAGVLTTA